MNLRVPRPAPSLFALCVACGSPERGLLHRSADAGTGGAPPEVDAPELTHTFEPLTIAPSEEVTDLCQSWTIGNDAPLFVNTVMAKNDGGLHHSNWIWVHESQYAGPDGSWPCAERGFDQIAAGAFGGVFFAQSTQSRTDVQAFPPGVAFEVPPRARIIGDVHLLNPSGDELRTAVTFEVHTLPVEEVHVKLQPMAFTNTALDIAPMMVTHARMQCATPAPSFDIYYVLPHFHSLGTAMNLTVAGGPLNGVEIYRSTATYGSNAGQTFDPPIAVTGAAGLAVTCEYENPRASAVHYGVGDQEMCVALIYSTGPKSGGTTIGNLTVIDSGGVRTTDALCIGASAP